MEWMILPLKRYVQFTGRSRRKEFWMWILFQFLVGIVLSLLDTMLGLGGHATGQTVTGAGNMAAAGNLRGGILSNVFTLIALLPNIAVSVRRLHDTNRSGWWILLPLVPFLVFLFASFAGLAAASAAVMILSGLAGLAFFVCGILLLVWYCTAGTVGPNRFGDDPKGYTPVDLARTFE
jgi:uncharacterized membrane protein YhaH (DUF805 family)